MLVFAIVALFTAGLAQAQTMLKAQQGLVRIQNTDLAVFEAGENRKDLPCVVSPDKPFLGFDLRFHAGYDVSVPLRELAGNENLLTILFRVYPENQPDQVSYFVQRIRVPAIEEDAKGDAFLQGTFDLGEGRYKVDWLMRDRAERVCSFSWDTEASLANRDKQIAVAIPPGVVEATRQEQFHEDPPVERSTTERLLNLKILVNFAPQKATASTMRPLDTAALVSILRSLNREPRIGKFTVVAFNMQEQRVFFRQEKADRIDFRGLGESLNSVSLGTVDLRQLAVKNSETLFLNELLAQELPTSGERPDAVIFAGPKALLAANVPEQDLRRLTDIDYPLFYLNYILNPQATPWRDAIGNAVRFLKGTEFTISRPRDLFYAVTDMVSRIVKSRNGKEVAAVSTQ
jgi:hypothetical protein